MHRTHTHARIFQSIIIQLISAQLYSKCLVRQQINFEILLEIETNLERNKFLIIINNIFVSEFKICSQPGCYLFFEMKKLHQILPVLISYRNPSSHLICFCV